MTDQEIYNTVVKHLLDQGGPALTDNGDCMYRTPGGRKCAAGALIPDDKYDPDCEGSYSDAAFEVCGVTFPDDQLYLIRELQTVHDWIDTEWPEGSDGRANLFGKLSNLRAKFKLQPLGPETARSRNRVLSTKIPT